MICFRCFVVSREGIYKKKQGRPEPPLLVLVSFTFLLRYRIKDTTQIQT